MQITVPFIYEAAVVFKGKRKTEITPVRDSIVVNIREFTGAEMPAAIRVVRDAKRSYLYSAGDTLWSTNVYDSRPVLGIDVKNITEGHAPRGPSSSATSHDPFHNVWNRFSDEVAQKLGHPRSYRTWFLTDAVLEHDELPVSKWCGVDTRDMVVSLIQSIADCYVLRDGVMMSPVNEPYYAVTTFGFGGSRDGGTRLFLERGTPTVSDKYFTLNELNEAIDYASSVARKRGDHTDLIVPHEDVEVLMPEAIKLPSVYRRSWFIGRFVGGELVERASAACLDEARSLVKQLGVAHKLFPNMDFRVVYTNGSDEVHLFDDSDT